MGKIKKRYSLKWRLIRYIPICAVLAILGTYVIGISTNELQTWYNQKFSEEDAQNRDKGYELVLYEDGTTRYEYYEKSKFTSSRQAHEVIYWIISNTQIVLVPLWVFGCVAAAGFVFYKRELADPITILMDASEKISQNQLDFKLEKTKPNELGELCDSFEHMRESLYQSNQEIWRMLEERKRLNAAFSHDMRTPITVLKGYADLLEKYIPDGKISEEKLLEVLEMMSGQISRLESYTQKMSAVQRLEDVVPDAKETSWKSFTEACRGGAKMLASKVQLDFVCKADVETVNIDQELVLEVYENLISNAARYAKEHITVQIVQEKSVLEISIEDDGIGFSKEALEHATNPFYKEESKQEENKREAHAHFGLGLYICKVICEKSGGSLLITNSQNGGKVVAKFLT